MAGLSDEKLENPMSREMSEEVRGRPHEMLIRRGGRRPMDVVNRERCGV